MKEWNPAENSVGNDERQRRIRAAQQRLHLLQLPGDAGKYAFAALDSLMELLQRLRPDISEAAEETIFIYRLRGLDLCRFNAWQGGIQFILTAGSENGIKLDEPFATSRLWLGVGLFGTGDFQLRKRAAQEQS